MNKNQNEKNWKLPKNRLSNLNKMVKNWSCIFHQKKKNKECAECFNIGATMKRFIIEEKKRQEAKGAKKARKVTKFKNNGEKKDWKKVKCTSCQKFIWYLREHTNEWLICKNCSAWEKRPQLKKDLKSRLK